MADVVTEFPQDQIALKALMALHLEAPESVARDVHKKVTASIDARDAEIRRLRRALENALECLACAEIEGIHERMVEQADKSDGSLYGLVARRLFPAFDQIRLDLT